MQRKGPYQVLSSQSKYKNPWIEVVEEKVIRPEGREGVFGIINYGKGTSTVALDANNNIYLVREYYYALEEYGIQVPSGDIADGETALAGAQREVLEEVGAVSNEWTELGFVNPLTMILKSPAYLFLAQNAEITQAAESEIERIVMPFQEAFQMVIDSKITHAPSCVAIFKASAYLNANSSK